MSILLCLTPFYLQGYASSSSDGLTDPIRTSVFFTLSPTVPPTTILFSILLCLTLHDFTYHGRSSSSKRVKRWLPRVYRNQLFSKQPANDCISFLFLFYFFVGITTNLNTNVNASLFCSSTKYTAILPKPFQLFNSYIVLSDTTY